MTQPKPSKLPSYTNDEVASILTRVLDRQNEGGRISHDELLETAREIGMTTLEIEASIVAETNLRAALIMEEQAQERERARQQAQEQELRRRAFFQHLAVFIGLGAFAFALDTQLGHGTHWYWPMLAWGTLLSAHAARTFRPVGAHEKKSDVPITPS